MDEAIVKPYLALIVGVVAVSFAAIFIRLAEAPSLIIAAYRLTIASLILTPPALCRSREELRSMGRKDFLLALAAGLSLALHFSFWITSLKYTSVASSVVFVTIHPLFVGGFSHFLLKERLSRFIWTGIVVSVIGGMIIGFGDMALGLRELFGDFLAILGAMVVAAYFLIGRRLRARSSLLSYIFPVYWSAAAMLVAFCLASGQSFTGYSNQTYLMFILLATLPQLVGHSSFNWALRYLSASYVAISVLGEPIGATILAYLILDEVPTIFKAIGGALILGGIYISFRKEESRV